MGCFEISIICNSKVSLNQTWCNISKNLGWQNLKSVRQVSHPTYLHSTVTAQLFFSWYDQLMIWFSADFQLILIRLVGSAGSKRGDSSQRDTQLSSSNSWFSASTIRSLNSLMKLYWKCYFHYQKFDILSHAIFLSSHYRNMFVQ